MYVIIASSEISLEIIYFFVSAVIGLWPQVLNDFIQRFSVYQN